MADDASKQLLTDWNFDQLIPRFERNGVNENVLREMSSEVLEELIPNVIDRVSFYKARREHFADSTIKDMPNNGDKSASKQVEGNENAFRLERQNCFMGRRSYYASCCSVRQALLDDPDGRNILSNYGISKCLNPTMRKTIVNIITRVIRQQSRRFDNEHFAILAQKIVEVFPTETTRTYYTPPICKKDSSNGKSIPSKGKLPIAYRNKCQKYKLLKPDDSKQVPISATTNEGNADVVAYKTWLEVNNSPWATVEFNWNMTRDLRKRELIQPGNADVGTFVENWPILKHPDAYLLIEKDFLAMQLSDIRMERAAWDSFFEDVQSIRPISRRDSNAASLADLITLSGINADTRTTVQILLLSHLIPPTTKVSKTWKPTVSECKDSMLMHIENVGAMIHARETQEKTQRARKLSLQPFIFAVGPTVTNIQESYVCMGKIVYKVPSILKALEVCFQIFEVLDAKYPLASKHLWALLREGFYGIAPELGTNISEIMSDLTVHRQKSSSTNRAVSDN